MHILNHITYLHILNLLLAAVSSQVGPDGAVVQTKLFLHHKLLRSTALQEAQNLVESLLPIFIKPRHSVKDYAVEDRVSEEQGSHSTDDIFLIRNKEVYVFLPLAKRTQMIIVIDCLLQDHDKLLDVVN